MRRLTLPMIWKVSREWKISAETLVEPYKLVRQATRRTPRAGRRKAA